MSRVLSTLLLLSLISVGCIEADLPPPPYALSPDSAFTIYAEIFDGREVGPKERRSLLAFDGISGKPIPDFPAFGPCGRVAAVTPHGLVYDLNGRCPASEQPLSFVSRDTVGNSRFMARRRSWFGNILNARQDSLVLVTPHTARPLASVTGLRDVEATFLPEQSALVLVGTRTVEFGRDGSKLELRLYAIPTGELLLSQPIQLPSPVQGLWRLDSNLVLASHFRTQDVRVEADGNIRVLAYYRLDTLAAADQDDVSSLPSRPFGSFSDPSRRYDPRLYHTLSVDPQTGRAKVIVRSDGSSLLSPGKVDVINSYPVRPTGESLREIRRNAGPCDSVTLELIDASCRARWSSPFPSHLRFLQTRGSTLLAIESPSIKRWECTTNPENKDAVDSLLLRSFEIGTDSLSEHPPIPLHFSFAATLYSTYYAH